MKMKTLAFLLAILSFMAGATGAEARRASKAYTGYRTANAEHTYRAPRARAARHESTGSSWFSGWSTASAERSYRAPRRERTVQRTAHRETTSASLFGGFRSASVGGHDAGPRPAKWCGWYMRTQLGGGPEYNIASNWNRYGRPSGPQVGAVVVWPHHVGMITGRSADGRWIVKSGNYSGGVHEVPMSVKGANFRI